MGEELQRKHFAMRLPLTGSSVAVGSSIAVVICVAVGSSVAVGICVAVSSSVAVGSSVALAAKERQ